MAITDVDVFTHLTDADIESLGVELDAIRQDIEDSRGDGTRATSAAPSQRSGHSRWPAGCCWPPVRGARPGGRAP